MYLRKDRLFDAIVYLVFFVAAFCDFITNLFALSSLAVGVTFFIIAIMSVVVYFMDDIYLSINKILTIFSFLFCYYAPYHQYMEGVNIHGYATYTDQEYLFANFLIILFLAVYIIVKRTSFKTTGIMYKPVGNFCLNDNSLMLLTIVSIACLIFLQATHQLISTTEADSSSESLGIVITKIVRFFPVSSLMLMIFAKKSNRLYCSRSKQILFFVLIGGIVLTIFFPLNGIISRYLLFGTYLMLIVSCFDEVKHPSVTLIFAIIGFYYIFPAFNFFKYNSINNLAEFTFGGFDASFADYDAYQMFLQTIRYVSEKGFTWGSNLLAALLNFIPRSIWHGKAKLSGALIASYYNKSFTNLSCPLFAELYLAFGPVGIIVGTGFFTRLLQYLEEGRQDTNFLSKGYYSICIGILFAFLRGSLLPESSFWLCLTISYTCAYIICLIFGNPPDESDDTPCCADNIKERDH